MYKNFYGLGADPFRLSPDHGFCLRHSSFARARAYMQYALERKEGFVVITGAPGTGKTTLIDDLLADASAGDFHVARLVSAQLEADDLLRMVGYAFGIVADDHDKSSLLHRLSERFGANHRMGRRPLLIVDEAQGLSHGALEELRLLTNLRSGGEPLLQIFLIGQEELRDIVNSPVLEQLNQRVIASCQISPLKPGEVVSYIRHRLEVAGWKGKPLFEPKMFPELVRYSKGVPRRINHICSRLLLHGMLEERKMLNLEDLKLVMIELAAEHYIADPSHLTVTLDEFAPEDLEILSKGPAAKPASIAKPTGTGPAALSASVTDPVPVGPEQSLLQTDAMEPDEVARPAEMLDLPVDSDAALIKEVQALVDEMAEADTGTPVGMAATPDPAVISLQTAPSTAEVDDLAEPPSEQPANAAAAIWGLAFSLMLLFALFTTVLISAPEHEFRQFVKMDSWGDMSVGRIRSQISRWTGGNWPFADVAGELPNGLRVIHSNDRIVDSDDSPLLRVKANDLG